MGSGLKNPMFLVLLLLLPTVLVALSMGIYFYVSFSFLFVFIATASVLFFKNLNFNFNKKLTFNLLFLLLISVSYFRGAIYGTIDNYKAISLVFVWISISCFFYLAKSKKINVITIFYSLLFYIGLNFFLWFLDINFSGDDHRSGGESSFLGLIGINYYRVLFPISLGYNGFGIIAGLAASISLTFFIYRKSICDLMFFSTCFYSLLLSDSRGGMGAFVLTSIFLLFHVVFNRKSISRFVVRAVLWLTPVLSLIVFYSVNMLDKFNENLSRGDDLLSYRGYIWKGVYDALVEAELIIVLFGSGYMGQQSSGASLRYEDYFMYLGGEDAVGVNAHSSFLQNVLDLGVLGAFIVIFALFKISRYASSSACNGINRALIYVFIIYVSIAGATDLTVNYNNLIVFTILVSLLFYLTSLRDGHVYEKIT